MRFWKVGKLNLARKSRPPDCAITSVSSREYVCFHLQPIKWQDCIGIDGQNSKNSKNRKTCKSQLKNIIFGARRQRRQPLNNCYLDLWRLPDLVVVICFPDVLTSLVWPISMPARLQHPQKKRTPGFGAYLVICLILVTFSLVCPAGMHAPLGNHRNNTPDELSLLPIWRHRRIIQTPTSQTTHSLLLHTYAYVALVQSTRPYNIC